MDVPQGPSCLIPALPVLMVTSTVLYLNGLYRYSTHINCVSVQPQVNRELWTALYCGWTHLLCGTAHGRSQPTPICLTPPMSYTALLDSAYTLHRWRPTFESIGFAYSEGLLRVWIWSRCSVMILLQRQLTRNDCWEKLNWNKIVNSRKTVESNIWILRRCHFV